MEVVLEGYLNQCHNEKLFQSETSLKEIKNIHLKLLDRENIKKLTNVLKHWEGGGSSGGGSGSGGGGSGSDQKIFTPITCAPEGGLMVKILTPKFTKYLGPGMIKLSINDWNNKKYKIRFGIKKYVFNDHGEKIHGLNFILKSIELYI
jgi:hypothetical protein